MKKDQPHPGWQERSIQLLGEEKFSKLKDANMVDSKWFSPPS